MKARSGFGCNGQGIGRDHGSIGGDSGNAAPPMRYSQPALRPSNRPALMREAMQRFLAQAADQAAQGEPDPAFHGHVTGFIEAAHLIGAMSDGQASSWRQRFASLLPQHRPTRT